MSETPSSYAEWEQHFAAAEIDEIVRAGIEAMQSPALPQLAALRNRFLDVAFHDKATNPRMRGVAACWARSLESAIYVLFMGDDRSIQAFVADRDSGRKLALEHGYGTPLFLASEAKPGFMEKLFSGGPSATDAESQRRAFLAHVAFGRSDDDAEA